MEDSIVANGVEIGSNSRIRSGCLIGEGTVLGENASLSPFSRVAASPPAKDDDDSEDGALLLADRTSFLASEYAPLC